MVFYPQKESSTMKDPVCGMEVDKGEPLVHKVELTIHMIFRK